MAEPILCSNPDHSRPVLAVARLSWPDSQFKPATACASDRDWMIRDAMAEVRPILVEPIPEAYGECPICKTANPLRMDGTIRAHKRYGVLTCEGRGQKPIKDDAEDDDA